ncbi:hypothetical protein [Cupriavidus metallidurans]|uniref:hypothetical protein n=1 Tax=Cupriavidus metallidurans TaxID=119219 RepID=UPI000CE070D5|nr:hypothetical protein [Cupriavidus metallidurans]AVA33433.1 hypothetical protein C3Z06_07205 [Cupriavidus metallidurans]
MNDLDEPERRVRATVRRIRDYCRRNGIPMAIDGAIDEETAALMLGYAGADSLRKQASDGTNRVPYRLLGNRRLYRDLDIAREIERSYSGGG